MFLQSFGLCENMTDFFVCFLKKYTCNHTNFIGICKPQILHDINKFLFTLCQSWVVSFLFPYRTSGMSYKATRNKIYVKVMFSHNLLQNLYVEMQSPKNSVPSVQFLEKKAGFETHQIHDQYISGPSRALHINFRVPHSQENACSTFQAIYLTVFIGSQIFKQNSQKRCEGSSKVMETNPELAFYEFLFGKQFYKETAS